jgi:hypothetical protein
MDNDSDPLFGIYWCITTRLPEAFMPGWNDPVSLIRRLEAVLLRLGADMPIRDKAISLVLRLEITLKQLEVENLDPPGSCCSCLQNVPTRGHLPNCAIARDLQAIREWKRSFIPGDYWN